MIADDIRRNCTWCDATAQTEFFQTDGSKTQTEGCFTSVKLRVSHPIYQISLFNSPLYTSILQNVPFDQFSVKLSPPDDIRPSKHHRSQQKRCFIEPLCNPATLTQALLPQTSIPICSVPLQAQRLMPYQAPLWIFSLLCERSHWCTRWRTSPAAGC